MQTCVRARRYRSVTGRPNMDGAICYARSAQKACKGRPRRRMPTASSRELVGAPRCLLSSDHVENPPLSPLRSACSPICPSVELCQASFKLACNCQDDDGVHVAAMRRPDGDVAIVSVRTEAFETACPRRDAGSEPSIEDHHACMLHKRCKKRVHDVVDVLAAERSRDAKDGEHVAHACHGALERSRHGRGHARGHGAIATWTGSMDKRKAG